MSALAAPNATWVSDEDLKLTFALFFEQGVQATLLFYGVRNREAVDTTLSEMAAKMPHDRYLADVAAFVSEDDGNYLVDTSQGALSINARAFVEC